MPYPPNDATCLQCGYPLRGLSTSRCPECGRAFDPLRPETFRRPDDPGTIRKGIDSILSAVDATLERPRRFLSHFGTGTIALATLIFLLTCADMGPRHQPQTLASLLLPWLWAVVLARLAFRTIRPAGRRAPCGWRAMTVALLLASIVVPSLLYRRTYSCPHGTLVMYGHYGIAHSPNGGPCRNFLKQREVVHWKDDVYLVFE